MRNPQGNRRPGYQQPPACSCRYGCTGATKRELFPLGGARGCNKQLLISTGIHYLSVTITIPESKNTFWSQIGFAERTGRDFETESIPHVFLASLTVTVNPCLPPKTWRPTPRCLQALFKEVVVQFLTIKTQIYQGRDSRRPSVRLDRHLACARPVSSGASPSRTNRPLLKSPRIPSPLGLFLTAISLPETLLCGKQRSISLSGGCPGIRKALDIYSQRRHGAAVKQALWL